MVDSCVKAGRTGLRRRPHPGARDRDRPERCAGGGSYGLTGLEWAGGRPYARATSAAIRVRQDDGVLRVEVADDGVGGADEGLGSGLRGLADRVEALEGSLRVTSPAGAGTTVCAELPCAS